MIKQPQAGIKIYNYVDRLGSTFYSGKKETQNIENVLKIKSEIISISTIKHKAQPAGEFQIVLAPTRNWISSISPGSWISIHMTSEKVDDKTLFSFNENTLKMIGRIDTVRMSMRVNQITGARETVYILAGRDWGQVFESVLYIDPIINPNLDNAAVALFSQDKFKGLFTDIKETGLQSTNTIIKLLISIWGESPLTSDSNINEGGRFINVQSPFNLPQELASELKLKSTSLSQSLIENLVVGKLSDYNKYDDSSPESYGLINPQSLIGVNTIWQVMSAHSCQEINEMFCDITWSNGLPKLTLFKRVKPFSLNSIAYSDSNTDSRFLHVYRTEIPKELITSLDCGDNWRDRVNAVEILPGHSVQNIPNPNAARAIAKEKSQKSDHVAIAREGLRPLLMQTFFYPSSSKETAAIERVTDWIPTFIDWYFNSHKMLNGSISLIGMSKQIPVGSNIVLDSSLFVKAPYVSKQNKNSKFIAHVESVSNNFSVEPNGTRSFSCGINFVRGVFVDSKIKDLINKDSFAIDSLATAIPSIEEFVKATHEV